MASPLGVDGGIASTQALVATTRSARRGPDAGRVVGVDAHGVRRPARERRECVRTGARGADAHAAHVDAVTRHADVVGRGAPADPGRRLRRACLRQRRRDGGRLCIRARRCRGHDPRLPGAIAGGVPRIDRELVAAAAHETGERRVRQHGRSSCGSVAIEPVAGDGHVVRRSGPTERDAGRGGRGDAHAGRDGRRRGVARTRCRRRWTGLRRGGPCRLAGAVAGRVVRVDLDPVAPAAGEPGHGVVAPGRRADDGSVAVDLVADNADVVARRGPVERDRGLVRCHDNQLAGSRRRCGVRARRGRHQHARGRRAVPGGVERAHTERVHRPARQTANRVLRGGGRACEIAVTEDLVRDDAEVVARGLPRERDAGGRDAGLPDGRGLRRRLCVGTCCRRGDDQSSRRAIAGRVVGADTEQVARSARERRVGVAALNRGSDALIVAEGGVTSDAAAISRRTPGDRDRGLSRRGDLQVARLGRRRPVGPRGGALDGSFRSLLCLFCLGGDRVRGLTGSCGRRAGCDDCGEGNQAGDRHMPALDRVPHPTTSRARTIAAVACCSPFRSSCTMPAATFVPSSPIPVPIPAERRAGSKRGHDTLCGVSVGGRN